MQYVYMNEQIRKEKPSRPVIVAQDDILGHTQVREANEFELWYKGQKIGRVKYDPAMLPACETHEVKAWVELDDLVQIVDPRDVREEPVAKEKKPNTKIEFAQLRIKKVKA